MVLGAGHSMQWMRSAIVATEQTVVYLCEIMAASALLAHFKDGYG
jgi:hypothetical protein